ncbi:Guanosine-3',5'-bis(diphosphate) 3'-pyrophosphohydrolase / GTP pyrophosphokinase, (p)ppGpp synthetase II [hydrothermal vent metagenome]|uniref:Guanosine-3',5'-bis(Diphosphate) 3'-pyrophosphohydrolase / GTP pyrophosphokinase, (P)ppGpp synthetase II n=1 Tax=hydrothermal vent metagenome TaxID=652676 RepID=A0A3B0XNV4_9ZZZZ
MEHIEENLIEKSLQIALNAYAGQKDKAGKAYILHPLRLMAEMQTEEEMSVALLHDVIEDSDYTAQDLLGMGIPENIVKAVQLLSKVDGESYDDFIDRVLKNKLALKIKKADIEDNINVLRLNSLESKDLERVAKYHRAWQKLNNP